MPLEHRERGGRGLHLGVGDSALLFRRPGDCGGMVGFRFGDVGLRGRHVVGGLIERLLRGGVAARQRGGAAELLLPHTSSFDFALAISAASAAICSARTPA